MYKDQIEKISPKVQEGHCVAYEQSEIEALKEFALQHAEDRPKPKVIDMTACIASVIDVMFSDYKDFSSIRIGKLRGIDNSHDGLNYTDFNLKRWLYCRPRMNHKHAWLGGDRPVPEGIELRVCFRNGNHTTLGGAVTNNEMWRHDGGQSDIIWFEVTGKDNGYIWPWEEKESTKAT